MIRRLAIAALLIPWLAFGCSQIETDDHIVRDDGSDSLSPEECEALNPSTDEAGFCRAGDGRFAPAQCCAASAVCKAAVLDDDGSCRRADDGKFAPASCCAAKCDNAEIDTHGFCRAESGMFAPAACCADTCFAVQAPPGSCTSDSCGDAGSEGECFCDEACTDNGDCCANKVDVCGGNGIIPPVFESHAGSCSEATCGGASEGGACFCDDDCTTFGDCCKDKVSVCGGKGIDTSLLVQCDADECEGTHVVDGVCRQPNGRFAKATCCAEIPVCESADVDGQGACRSGDGDSVPSLCCDAICSDASIDASGMCHNGDGAVAPASCCADACFDGQERPGRDRDVSRLPACNGDQD